MLDANRGHVVRTYLRGASASFLSKVLSTCSSFVALWLLTRILGPEDFGGFAVAMAWVSLVALLATFGLDGSLLYVLAQSDIGEAQLQGAAAFRWTLRGSAFAGGLGAAALFVGGTVLTSLAAAGTVGPWLCRLAPVVPFSTVSAVFEAWYQANHRVSTMFLLPRSVDISRAFLLAVAWKGGAGPSGVAAAYLVSAATAPLLWLCHPASHPLYTTVPAALPRTKVVYGFKLMLSRAINNMVERLDILMLGALAPGVEAARFAVASRLATPVGAPKDLFGPVFTPRIRRHISKGDRPHTVSEYRLVQHYYFTAALGLAFCLTAAAPWLFQLFPRYRSAMPVLVLLVGAYAAKMAFGPATSFLAMAGGSGTLLAITLVALSVMGGLNLLLIPRFGAVGAASGTLLGIVFIQSLTAFLVHREHGLVTLSAPLALMLFLVMVVVFTAAVGILDLAGVVLVVGLVFAASAARTFALSRVRGSGA